jgi:hypothetical protein
VASNNVVTAQISAISKRLFVRVSLDDDRVLFFVELIEAGEELPPLQVTRDMVLIDGRHRLEAYEFCDKADVRVELVDVKDEAELIAMAYVANCGGALPPTTQDTEHTVTLLLDRGVTKKRIGEMLHLPPGLARKFITSVESKVARTSLLNAVSAVTNDGYTAPKAAEEFGVDLDKLKDALSGARKRHREGIGEVQRELTVTFKSSSAKVAAVLKNLFAQFDDGDVTVEQCLEVFGHLEKSRKAQVRVLSDWKARFDAKRGVTTESTQSDNGDKDGKKS